MTSPIRSLRRAGLPLLVFAAVLAIHFVWHGLFPERDPAQERWAPLPPQHTASWLTTYLRTGAYWIGYAYALSLTFAAIALRHYRERRLCRSRNLAIGGVTFSGFLAVAGCFLLGCCGSPMLLVYLNLFGAAFLPLAKPLVALFTTVIIALAACFLLRNQPAPQHPLPAEDPT